MIRSFVAFYDESCLFSLNEPNRFFSGMLSIKQGARVSLSEIASAGRPSKINLPKI